MSDTIDNATLRVAYERGSEACWREGFPEHTSLTDMERAAHTAGLREVLRLLPPPPMPSEEEIIALADDFRAGHSMDSPCFCFLDDGKLRPSLNDGADMTPGVIAFAHRLLEHFGARSAA